MSEGAARNQVDRLPDHRDVERLERLVVHVEEGLRMAAHSDDAHLRLALMLLDSAVELMMHRECESSLAFQTMYQDLLRSYEAIERAEGTLPESMATGREELRSKVISKTQRGKIDRFFDAKAEYLAGNGLLPEAETRVLKKLHEYRNAAYHRDSVRSGSLQSAVRVYAHLTLKIMRDLEPHGMGWGATVPAGLVPYVGDGQRFPGFDLQAQIATKLMNAFGLAEQADLGRALATHLSERLSALREDLEWIAGFLNTIPGQSGWDETAVLHMVQADGLTRALMSATEARSAKSHFRMSHLDALTVRARALEHQPDQLVAFAEFADVEDAFEAVEERTAEMSRLVDSEIDLQIDIARGK